MEICPSCSSALARSGPRFLRAEVPVEGCFSRSTGYRQGSRSQLDPVGLQLGELSPAGIGLRRLLLPRLAPG
jgi:hypothetical protein